MNVLMFGWEFPPAKNYGLGRVCYHMTKGLSSASVGVTLVLPTVPEEIKERFLDVVNAADLPDKLLTEDFSNVTIEKVRTILNAYISDTEYKDRLSQLLRQTHLIENNLERNRDIYGGNIIEEVYRYAGKASTIARNASFDVIHAHDWMTGMAGAKAKEATGRPFVFQVHSTELDRSGGHPDPVKFEIEKNGMVAADKIIAVSELTKQKMIEFYGIPADKIEVVYNAVHEIQKQYRTKKLPKVNKNDQIVLFLGRLTIQKGPEYFLEAAKKVLQRRKRVKFVFVGSGDMMRQMINMALQLGIEKNVVFLGALGWEDVDMVFQRANVFVMPSVSEPFGVVALESMKNGTPAIISRQSGVSEMVKNVLKVNFWDINDMAEKILSVLSYSPLSKTMKSEAKNEVDKITWDSQSEKIARVYQQAIDAKI